jgi:hypothetical protein
MGGIKLNSKHNKIIGIVFMMFALIIIGAAMSNPLTKKQQAKASERIVEMFASKEEKVIASDSVNGQLIIHFIDVGDF